MSNAGRFTLTGGVHIDVEMKDQEIVCHVRDTGPGIAAENQIHLFEPFQQADGSIRREHSGSGLGLHISKQLIEMHDGRIWLESKEGVGTTISFSLPVVGLRNWEGEAVSDAKRWVGDYTLHEPRGRPFRGHVADPLPLYVLVEKGSRLKRIFSRYSNEVDTISCKNISDAIEVVSSMSAKAVILNSAAIFNSSDNKKEILNPYDLSYDTPVITCWCPGVEDMTQSLNVVDHVRKPFTVDELREAIHGAGNGIKSILLIDEEEDVLQLLMRILVSAPEGYRVWRASSGERGIEMMRDRKPDLVIMDLGLPDVNGWEILSQKSQDNDIRAIPVIILSAKDEAVEDLPANIFMIRRKSGLSVREFVKLIQSVTQTLENNP